MHPQFCQLLQLTQMSEISLRDVVVIGINLSYLLYIPVTVRPICSCFVPAEQR